VTRAQEKEAARKGEVKRVEKSGSGEKVEDK
jgi:hypothetical protein